MSARPSTRARQVLSALIRIGWEIKRESGTSHKVLSKTGFSHYIFAFHDKEEIGPKMLARISKHTGLKPDDLKNHRTWRYSWLSRLQEGYRSISWAPCWSSS